MLPAVSVLLKKGNTVFCHKRALWAYFTITKGRDVYMLESIQENLGKRASDVVRLQTALTALPALGPENDGIGEEHKAAYIVNELKRRGIKDIRQYNAPDSRVPCGYRPNIVTRIEGKSPRTLWILGHMDVVPPGDASLWKGNPWVVRVEEDVLIGRGVEDNQQAIVSGLLLLEEVQKAQELPELSLGCVFVADEETQNTYGIEWLMREHGNIFNEGDMFVVPDFGNAAGSLVEIAEKHVLWLRITTEGKQCHGSTPHRGHNAMLAGSAVVVALQTLYAYFPEQDALFDPPMSTFTPTKREANVPNVNTVPARDVFYMDCRLLPSYSMADVLAKVQEVCAGMEKQYQVRITVEVESSQEAAAPTPADSPVVAKLLQALQERGIEAKLAGIGGGTVAKELRHKGFHAAVWSRILSNCHEPEEKALISNAIFDAQIFAQMIYGKEFLGE